MVGHPYESFRLALADGEPQLVNFPPIPRILTSKSISQSCDFDNLHTFRTKDKHQYSASQILLLCPLSSKSERTCDQPFHTPQDWTGGDTVASRSQHFCRSGP